MNKSVLYIVVFLFYAIIAGCLSNSEKRDVARLEGDRLVLTFDRRWDEEKKKEIAVQYDIDSSIIEAAFSTKDVLLPDTAQWKIEKSGNRFVEVSKTLGSEDYSSLTGNDILLLDEGWLQLDAVEETRPVTFGVNLLNDDTAIEFEDSVVTFRLKGYEDAAEVFLAGSFNGWSTMKMPMKRKPVVINGSQGKIIREEWSISFVLDPGRYTYKYIIDGKWITDPSNLLREREERRGSVSVVYMPDKIFELEGKPEARDVVLTGSFINWSRAGIPMKRSGDKWIIPVYLNNGTWSYKFISDGEWLADPSNPDTREDASGNMNSFINIGEKYLFRLKGFTEAGKVVLAGSFNNFNSNDLVMEKDDAGWKLEIALDPGNWEYKFIVDGEWMADPDNPYITGSGDYINSLVVLKPNYTFILKGYEGAGNVVVTGTFNNWDPSGYRMVKDGMRWRFPIRLKQGKCLYKFIVDGEWMRDPANENWEDNEYGTGNSVLWVEK